ncbi:MAG: NAD(P)H-binding protein [Ginsengibacter sp.]
MKDLTAVVLGATGLTGDLVVQDLLNDNDYKTVRVLVRNSLSIIHPKLEQYIVDFNDKKDFTLKMGEGDVIFSCIGTTQKKVKGDKFLYEKIDHDIPVNAAEIGIAHHFKKFLLISSVGANEKSSNFYLSLKGKTENSLKQFPFESISIFQPSLLNGTRKEWRFKEQLTQTLMDLISFLFLGPFRKYHAIGANTVANAMVFESKQNKKGIYYYQYEQMMDLAREFKAEIEDRAEAKNNRRQ